MGRFNIPSPNTGELLRRIAFTNLITSHLTNPYIQLLLLNKLPTYTKFSSIGPNNIVKLKYAVLSGANSSCTLH